MFQTRSLALVALVASLASAAMGQQLTASPASLTFNVAAGSGQSAAQAVTLSVSAPSAALNQNYLGASLSDGWLVVADNVARPSVAPSHSTTYQISVNVGSLAAGSYTGYVVFQHSNAQAYAMQVNLLVGGGSGGSGTLTPSPTSLNFFTTPGGSQTQNLSVSNIGVSSAYTVTSNASWLTTSVGSLSVSTPNTFTVTANAGSPVALGVGTYQGLLTLTPTTGGSASTVQVNLTVSSSAQLQVNPSGVTFSYVAGSGAASPSTNLVLTSSTTSTISYTATPVYLTGGQTGWLSVSPSSGSLNNSGLNVTVTANPTGLASGVSYTARIDFVSGSNTVSVPVTFNVTGAGTLTPVPTTVQDLVAQPGATSVQRTISVSSSNSINTPFTPTVVYTNPSNPTVSWLQLTNAGVSISTPSTLTFNALTTSGVTTLALGTYDAVIRLTVTGTASFVDVPVRLTVTNNSILSVAPTTVSFNHVLGQAAPGNQNITVSLSPAAGQTYNAIFVAGPNSPTNLLFINPTVGSLSAASTITLGLNTQAITTAGTYSGELQIFSTGSNIQGSPARVQVTVTVTGVGGGGTGATDFVYPSSLQFFVPTGATNSEQQISLTSAGANTAWVLTPQVSTPSGGAWLSMSQGSGTTPATPLVRVNPSGLAAGTYFGQLLISGTGTARDGLGISVTMTVSGNVQVQPSPSALTFSYQAASGNIPSGQSISLLSTSGAAVPYSATATSNGNWLQVSPSSGASNSANLIVTLNTAALLSLSTGIYEGTITLSFSGASNPSVFIPVKLAVTTTSGTGSGNLSSLVVSPAAVNFYAPAGVNPSQQLISLVQPNGTPSYTASATTNNGGSWLSVNTNTNGSIVLTATAASLSAGTYTGNVLITSAQLPNGSVNVPVNLVVNPAVALVPFPQGMVFTHTGSGTPSGQFLTLTTSNNSGLPFTLNTTTTSGGNWLSVQQSSANAPASLFVTVNPAGLATGVYTGNVRVSTSGTYNPTADVEVKLVVTSGSGSTGTFQFNPTPLRFYAQPGGTQPPNQQVTVTTTGPVTNYVVTTAISSPSGGSWLQVASPSGVTPGTLIVGVNPGSLPVGTYDGTVTVQGGGSSSNLPVQLVVTNNPLLRSSTSNLNYNYQSGSPLPASRAIAVTTSNSSSLTYSASATVTTGANWLQVVQPSSQTPGVFLVSLLPSAVQALGAGTYTGNVVITAAGAENSPLSIPVNLTVSQQPQILLSSNSPLSFTAAFAGTAPPAQTVNVTSSGTAVNLAASVNTSTGVGWLSAQLNTTVTPAVLTVTTNPFGLSTGVYNGLVSVTSGSSTATIPVTLTVSSAPLLNVTPRELNFGGGGTGTQSQTLTITSTGSAVGYSVSSNVASPFGGNWLQVNLSQAAGTTPGTVSISVVPTSLPDGTYFGSVTVSASGVSNSPIVIPVVLTVNNATALLVNPGEITFNQQQGASAPAAVPVQVTSQVSTPFLVTVQSLSGAWLDVSPTSGLTSTLLSVRPNALASTLAPGRYTATVTVSGTSSPNNAQFTVILNVTPPFIPVPSPTQLNFTARERSSTPPAAQNLQVTIAGGLTQGIIASASTDGGGGWLTVTPTTITTPGTFSVSVNPANLAVGSYTGTINLALASSAATPVAQVRVSLTVERAVQPNITTIANGASFQAGALSPGLVVSLFGTGLGPDTGLGLQVSGGRVTRNLGGVRVLFDGVEAPLLFVRGDQVNCVVPYEMVGRAQATVQVDNNGVLSNQITPRINETAPAAFTIGGTQAAFLNQDNTVNGPARPIDRGNIGVIYMTGEGQLNPAGVNGEVTATIKRPLAPVSIRVGGVDVTDIQFAGAAPGLVQGVLQINFRIPDTAPTGGTVPLEVTIGGRPTQAGVTIAIR